MNLLEPAFLRRLEGLTLRTRRLYRGQQTGSRRTPRRGAGLEFADHRAYVAGDDLRHLDWPLLARLGRPFVKTYEEQQDLQVHLLLDTSRSMRFGEPQKLATATQLAAALGHVAIGALDRVGAAFYDGSGLRHHEPTRGAAAFFPLLRFLAGATPQGGAGGDEALRLHAVAARPGLTIVFSDFLEQNFERLFQPHIYRKHTLVFVQILARQEIEPELEGDLALHDDETGERVEVTVGAREIEAYRTALERHRERLRRFGARYGAEVFSLVSDVPLEDALRELLRGRFLGTG